MLRASRRENSSEGFKAASKGVTSMLSQPPIAARHRLGRPAQQVVVRGVSGDSPARGDALHHGLRRVRLLRLELRNRLGPHHAEGAQLGNLEEIVGAGGKDKEDFRADFIDIEPAFAEFGKILDPGSQREGKLLDDGPTGLCVLAGANGKRAQQRERRFARGEFQELSRIGENLVPECARSRHPAAGRPADRNRPNRRPRPRLSLRPNRAREWP